MAYVSRGVSVTSCEVIDLVDPEFEPQPFEVGGKISPARLASRVRKEFGPTAAIRNVETNTRTYRMTLDDFIATAEIVED